MNAKTLFAALAATSMAAVYGAPIDSMGFEDYGTGVDTVKNVTTGYDDYGVINTGTSKFYYTGSAEDNESIVTNDVGSYSGTFPQGFASLGAQVLHLETGSGILFRAINGIESDGEGGYTAKTGESFAGTPLYIDTLVQFTPVEDGAPETSTGDKLAIWLNAGDSATNLCVRAGYWTKDGESATDKTGSTNYTLVVEDVSQVEAGKWYRLTVKAIGNVAESHPGFEIYLDGNRVYSMEAVSSNATLADYFKEDSKTVTFPSMSSDQSICAVGFQGNGAVDDLVVTADMPAFLIHEINFTLNWDANVTAIQYSINEGALQSVAISAGTTNATVTVNAGDTVQFLYENVTISDKTPAWTTDGSAEDSIAARIEEDSVWSEEKQDYVPVTLGWNYTISAAGAVINLAYTGGSAPAADGWVADSTEIPADTTVATQYPTLASTAFADVDAKKLTDWANDNGVVFSDTVTTLNGSDSDAIDDIVDAYLLNCALNEVDTEKEEFINNINITMVDGVPQISLLSGEEDQYNGTLKVMGVEELGDEWEEVAEGEEGDYNFFKYVLSL